ncbi:MAG: hypothetical protein ACYC35_12445 [Pirellulales bacterium]
MFRPTFLYACALAFLTGIAGVYVAEEAAAKPAAAPPAWLADYGEAARQAKQEHKMLLIFFHQAGQNPARDAFEADLAGDAAMQEKLARYVRVKVPVDAKISMNGKETRLLDHGAFAEMLGCQGVAIIDFAHEGQSYYGYVVSVFPFPQGSYYPRAKMAVVLDLPPGTLTQRTMVFAVRIHPERPASTEGELSSILCQETESHSCYQAQIRLQGHHRWETRFHLLSRLLGGCAPQEVCAESWPGQNLVDAAIECVHSWRQSSGHWQAVSGRHRLFSYDMKRGANGIWYATGLFSD